MQVLNRTVMPSLPVKALQFGEGNFLRAFIDWMIDEMNRQGKFNGLVQMVQPLPGGMGDLINQQGGLYTLILRGVSAGKVCESRQIITSVRGCLNPYTDWKGVVAAATQPELQFVFSNTTEAGIEYKEEPYSPGECQHSFPAKLTSMMLERWKAYGGAADKGVVFIPCELIDSNGATLRQCMLRHAADWRLPAAFGAWLQTACHYVNTLVDRIVAGYPRDEARKFCQELGYEDKLLDCGEVFHFFVLEGDPERLRQLPLKECGLNAVITDDQTPYRIRKVRFLNGAHTADVLAAAMAGLTYVDEMMNDPLFGRMVRTAICQEIFPTVKLPEEEKRFYADSVIERFLNPFAHHRLLSISLNSISKWKVRVLPTLRDYLQLRRQLPPVLSFSLSALLRFYRLTPSADGHSAGASLGDVSWPVADSPEVIGFFARIAALPTAEYVREALAKADFWDGDLNAVPGLAEAVVRGLESIEAHGIREAVSAVLQ